MGKNDDPVERYFFLFYDWNKMFLTVFTIWEAGRFRQQINMSWPPLIAPFGPVEQNLSDSPVPQREMDRVKSRSKSHSYHAHANRGVPSVLRLNCDSAPIPDKQEHLHTRSNNGRSCVVPQKEHLLGRKKRFNDFDKPGTRLKAENSGGIFMNILSDD